MKKIDVELDCTHDIVIKYGVAECQNCGLGESKIIKQLTDLEIEREEQQQETLEEAAEKQWGNVHRTGVLGFIEGAKWQAERMYSEEEVFNLLNNFNKDTLKLRSLKLGNSFNVKDWFEQFKKKKDER
jgi:hypothetical protein